MRLLERQAKLMGLNKPVAQRLEHTGKDGSPLGLPPELAALEPKCSHEEVLHYVKVDPGECALEGCRVHVGRALGRAASMALPQ